ncbi:exocyst complex component EXO70C1-like [Musa acuminata AAA Group]|uniref:exocyst complex component EXO70C1-like n=1 Tax=Musa acuminata AAA Group TaxID=214697 RepID=UPI0031D442EA
MERSQTVTQKFSSFSSSSSSTSGRDDKPREIDRSRSLGPVKLEKSYGKKERDTETVTIEEDEEEGQEEEEVEVVVVVNKEEEASSAPEEPPEASFGSISEEVDGFLSFLLSIDDGRDQWPEPPAMPEPTIKKFLDFVEEELVKYESGKDGASPPANDELVLFDAIDRVAKLTSALSIFSSDTKYNKAMTRASSILRYAMCFLEDEFHSLLEDSKPKKDTGTARPKTKRRPSIGHLHDAIDRCVPPPSEPDLAEFPSTYTPEIIERLSGIAGAVVSAGYATECCQVFTISRRNAFDVALSNLGYEKLGVDDVQKMPWDSLEAKIATWNKVFRQTVEVAFPREHDLCEAVFAGHSAIAYSIFHNFARGVTVLLLGFAEAVATTKRSAEKLFKVLDMYETLRDMVPRIDALLRTTESEPDDSSAAHDLTTEVALVRSRLGEAVVAIFCDLETSIKTDMGKNAVPGGAVHPLTRYVMNYLKYACEYKNTMEQVFRDHKNSENPSSQVEDAAKGGSDDNHNPFAIQLMEAMELLHTNLESKSKLYRDPALCSIFLMNNGRYVMQKIKGSTEIHQLLGDTWSRKRSSDLRQYHKNYQRETWSKVLACFKDDGLQARGHVAKPVLKERLKSFNSMFEEIHKAQSSWVVSDEQLQSELRVSVSAVIVPAYRSFLGRFSQYLDPGKKSGKYIKFGPEELENYIDELFSGNPSSMVSRKRT